MTPNPSSVLVSCALSTPELREREATLVAHFKSAILESTELPNGYAFRLPGDGHSIDLIAKLIIAERECCPFLAFDFTAQPDRGPVALTVTGPAGAKEFLQSLLHLKATGAPPVIVQLPDSVASR